MADEGAFNVGSVARLAITFNVDGVATNPTTVTLTLEQPDGVTSDLTGPQLDNPTTGSFRRDVLVSQAGQWKFRWVGTGAAAGAEQGSFMARTKVPA